MNFTTALWLGFFTYAFLITCAILLGIFAVYLFYKLCRQNTDNRYDRERYIENFEYVCV